MHSFGLLSRHAAGCKDDFALFISLQLLCVQLRLVYLTLRYVASTASACLSRYVVGCEYSLGLFMLLCIWLRVQLRLVYLAL